MSSDSSLSNDWATVAERVATARHWLKSPDDQAPPHGVSAWCQEILVVLARAVYVPELAHVLIGTVPIAKDAPRVLDEYLTLKLGHTGDEHSLRSARKLLDDSTSALNQWISTPQEATVCVEMVISVVNILASLSGFDPERITGAS